jgi:hypothetical protein
VIAGGAAAAAAAAAAAVAAVAVVAAAVIAGEGEGLDVQLAEVLLVVAQVRSHYAAA